MKRYIIPLVLISCIHGGLLAQPYQLAAEPMRDSVIIEYYFCFASTWDETTYYTNIFQRYQDPKSNRSEDTLRYSSENIYSKKDNLQKDWNKYIKQDLKLKKYTGFVKGPFYDSSYAVINRIKWMDEQPDTILIKEVFWAIEREDKPVNNSGNGNGNRNRNGNRNGNGNGNGG